MALIHLSITCGEICPQQNSEEKYLTLVPTDSCEGRGSLREALRALSKALLGGCCISPAVYHFPQLECLCKNVGKRSHLLYFVSAVFIWHKYRQKINENSL